MSKELKLKFRKFFFLGGGGGGCGGGGVNLNVFRSYRGKTGTGSFLPILNSVNDSKVFIEYSNDMGHIYKDIEE